MAGYTINNGSMSNLTVLQIMAIAIMRKIAWEWKVKQKALLTVG